jgi:TonB family protein
MTPARMVLTVSLTLLLAAASYCQEQASPPSSPPPNAPMRVRIGAPIEQTQLLTRVAPAYPAEAKAAHVQGTVVLRAIIGKDGKVENLSAISGPPLLLQASMDAVKQWVYKPLLLNGQPVEVETQISVVFTLDGGSASDSQPGPSASIDPQLRQDIVALLQATHMADDAGKTISAAFDAERAQFEDALPDTPNKAKIIDEYRDRLAALAQTEEFTDGVVEVYARHLSDDDVKALTAFYRSPAGERLNAAQADLSQGMMEVGRELAAQRVPGIFADICKEYPELQGRARFCPAGAPDSQPSRQ